MISEERLQEIERAPREACIFKAEAKELADAFRERDALLRKLHTMLEAQSAEPVAIVVSKHGDPERFGEREIRALADLRKIPYNSKLYAAPPTPVLPPGFVLVPVEPTRAMVEAYLSANSAYWERVDAMPTKIRVWRNGTPKEATEVSYRAMIAAAGDKT